MRHGQAHHETPSSQCTMPTTRPVALGPSALAALEFARLPSGGAGPREARYGAGGGVAVRGGGGDSWGWSQGSQGPAARTLGKARVGGLPGLCYLLSVSRPARHFLTALSTGRGQGPSPPSKGSQRCAWRPGAGKPGVGVGGQRQRGGPSPLLPHTRTADGGCPSPQVHPQGQTPAGRSPRQALSVHPLFPVTLTPSYAPHCRPPDARSPPSPALPPTAAEQIPRISCLWPPEHPLPAPPQQRTWGGRCAAAQCAGLGTRVGAVGFLEAGPASCQYCGSPDPTSSPLSWDDSRKQPPRPGLGVLPGSSERPGRREREGLSQG